MAAIVEEMTELKPLPKSAPAKVTFEEYLAWDSESRSVEWVDGEIVIMPNPSLRHQEIISFLSCILNVYNAKHGLGKIVPAPFAMKLEAISRGREPDILFVSKGREGLFEKNYLNGAADVAVCLKAGDNHYRLRRDVVGENLLGRFSAQSWEQGYDCNPTSAGRD